MKREPLGLSRNILAGLLMTALVGCVQKEYDLSKDLDLGVNVGGKEFSLPLGTTENITMASMIDTAKSNIIRIVDGKYIISKRDSMDVTMEKINPVYIDRIAPVIAPTKLDFKSPIPVPGGFEYTANAVVDPTEIVVNNTVPNDVMAVEKTMLTTPDYITIKITPAGFPANAPTMRLDNFVIEFPYFFIFDDSQVVNNTMTLNGTYSTQKPLEIKVKFVGYQFDTNPVVKEQNTTRIYIKETIDMFGQVVMVVPNNTSEFNAKLEYSVVSPKTQLGHFAGTVNPTIKDAIHDIDMSDLPDFVTEEGTILDLMNPAIQMNIANTVGIPINSALSAYPQNEQNENTADSVKFQFPIRRANPLGTPTLTKLWVSDTKAEIPEGYQFVEVERLPLLIRNVPNSIKMVIKSASNQQELHELDLNSSYSMKVNYDVNIPFKPGKDLKINYTTSFDGLNKDLKDILANTKQVIAKTVITNGIPLEMDIDLIPIDVAGDPIANVTVTTPGKIAAGQGVGAMVTTNYDLTVTTTVAGSLKKLDGFKLVLHATSNTTVAGIPLDENQYVKAKIDFKVPGGLSLDLND